MILRRKLTPKELDAITGYLEDGKMGIRRYENYNDLDCFGMSCDECIFGSAHKCVVGGSPKEAQNVIKQVKENNPEYFL